MLHFAYSDRYYLAVSSPADGRAFRMLTVIDELGERL